MPIVYDLFEMDEYDDTLNLKHLSVQQSKSDGANTTGTNGTDSDKMNWMRGGKGRRRGKKGNKRMRCMNLNDNSVDCLNAYYSRLDNNNEVEWVVAMKMWWWNQFRLGLFWWVFIPVSAWAGFLQLLWPNLKPDVDNAPWRDEDKPLTTSWYALYTMTTQISEPNLFFWSQLFTFGDSDLRDFAIIYMTPVEAWIYSIVNHIDLMINTPYAMMHTFFFGPIYAI